MVGHRQADVFALRAAKSVRCLAEVDQLSKRPLDFNFVRSARTARKIAPRVARDMSVNDASAGDAFWSAMNHPTRMPASPFLGALPEAPPTADV